jgi:hypothetical protein
MGSGGKRKRVHVIFEDWAFGLFWLWKTVLLMAIAGAEGLCIRRFSHALQENDDEMRILWRMH